MPHWPIPYGVRPNNERLSDFKKLLARLGNPEKRLPPTIHIAGTNGKGSTLAFLKSILEQAGYSVHRYTSPHLLRFNERIELNGIPISDSLLYQLAEECRVQAEGLDLTFFEGTTALAFLAFSRFPADVLLLETGMGGRLDPTKLAQNVIITIITTISYDHTEFLGDTLEQISLEKAGIIRKNTPCVISLQNKEVYPVLLTSCEEAQAPSFCFGRDWSVKIHTDSFSFFDEDNTLELPLPALPGKHQVVNAGNAIASLRNLPEFRISFQDIVKGLDKVKWPARMQKITTGALYSILPKGWELWIDGAHNESGAQALLSTISAWQGPVYMVHGRTKGKDIAGFLKHFLSKVDLLECVSVQYEPKSEPAANIYKVAKEMGFKANAAGSIREAIERCIAESSGQVAKVIVCGSLYLAADIINENE